MTAPAPVLRIGDAERDATVELLNRHFADGRLTTVEHEERVAAALTATTQPALDALLADLPDLDGRGRRVATRAPRRSGLPAYAAARLALLVALVGFFAVHVVRGPAVVLLAFLLLRLAFGWHRPWGGSRRHTSRR